MRSEIFTEIEQNRLRFLQESAEILGINEKVYPKPQKLETTKITQPTSESILSAKPPYSSSTAPKSKGLLHSKPAKPKILKTLSDFKNLLR